MARTPFAQALISKLQVSTSGVSRCACNRPERLQCLLSLSAIRAFRESTKQRTEGLHCSASARDGHAGSQTPCLAATYAAADTYARGVREGGNTMIQADSLLYDLRCDPNRVGSQRG